MKNNNNPFQVVPVSPSASSRQLPSEDLIQDFDEFNQIVATLYRCLHSDEGFTPFFDAFQQKFNVLLGGIIGVSEDPIRVMFGWTFGYPEGFESWYINSDLPQKDEALNRYSNLEPRKFVSFLDGDANKKFRDMLSAESQQWCDAMEIVDSTGMLVHKNDKFRVVFLANRHKDFGHYTELELRQLSMLAPHIENAVTLHIKLYQSQVNNESLTAVVENLTKPLVVLNEAGQLIKQNQTATQILDDYAYFQYDELGRLYSDDVSNNRKLTDCITNAVLNARKNSLETQSILLSGNQDIRCSITPLLNSENNLCALLLELFSPQVMCDVEEEVIQRLFNCSNAEAKIAIGLLHGQSAKEIAEKRFLSIHTVQEHTKSILRKNGYRRQTEFVAALARALS